MVEFTIAILQLSGPFVLIGLLIFWVYQISSRSLAVERKTRGLDDAIHHLHSRISETDQGLYKKICSVEERVEDIDDILMGVLERESERASKTSSKTK